MKILYLYTTYCASDLGGSILKDEPGTFKFIIQFRFEKSVY